MQHKKHSLFAVIIFYSFIAQAQTADEVVKKYVEYIGGQKRWQNVKTISTSGEYDYGGIKFPFQAYAKAPNKYKFIVPFNGKYYAQAFDGTKGWKIDAFKNETKPTMLAGKEALALANEADIELESAFINYQEKGHQISLQGKDSVQHKSCFIIKFIRKSGEIETYYFDEKIYSLTMKVAVSKNPEMQGALLTTMYSHYKSVDGIKIPFRAVSKSGDQAILTININKAELNLPVEDHEFQPQ